MFIVNPLCIYPGLWQDLYRGCINHFSYFFLRRMQCSFSIRHEVLPDVNCQFRGFDDEVDVLSQMISPSFTRLIKSSTTCVALHNIFHCDKNKLTPYLVGIVSVSQNLRSTLLLPFHSVSSVYLPPPRGTLTGIFNSWIWSLANVTAKASCTRSPWVRLNGMFNALLWSFDFDLRDMSNEVWVSALLSLLFIELRLYQWNLFFCILLSDWFFFPGFWLANRPEIVTSDWSDVLAVDWLTMEHISFLLSPDYRLSTCHRLDLDTVHNRYAWTHNT